MSFTSLASLSISGTANIGRIRKDQIKNLSLPGRAEWLKEISLHKLDPIEDARLVSILLCQKKGFSRNIGGHHKEILHLFCQGDRNGAASCS